MRELTQEELALISGGYNWGDEGPVVTGVQPPGFPYFPPDGPSFPPPPPSQPPYPYGGGSPPPTYPPGFDQVMDDRADAIAAELGAEMAAKPDVDKYEYVAVIWKDAAGNLHRTSVETDGTAIADTAKVWPQVDFANGGSVVAIMHSHPTLQNVGTPETPDWQPNPQSGTLSSRDFDGLMDRSKPGAAGYDTANYRSYMVNAGVVREYYAFQQDSSKVGAGGQATWAVASTDYGR